VTNATTSTPINRNWEPVRKTSTKTENSLSEISTGYFQNLLSRVRVSATLNNCGARNLIAMYLEIHSYNHSYYKFTTSLLTVLDHFCPAFSSLPLISVSDPALSVSSVSHSLKRILCGPEREHLIEQLGVIRCPGNSLPMYALSLSPRQWFRKPGYRAVV
jgi:hypothetical protein